MRNFHGFDSSSLAGLPLFRCMDLKIFPVRKCTKHNE